MSKIVIENVKPYFHASMELRCQRFSYGPMSVCHRFSDYSRVFFSGAGEGGWCHIISVIKVLSETLTHTHIPVINVLPLTP